RHRRGAHRRQAAALHAPLAARAAQPPARQPRQGNARARLHAAAARRDQRRRLRLVPRPRRSRNRMNEAVFFRDLVYAMLGLSAVTFAALSLITAPYGRHARGGWGPMVTSTVGWIVMEAPASLAFLAFYLWGEHRAAPVPVALLAMWQVHYVHRAFVY